MNALLFTFFMLLIVTTACDLRSETAKKEMEKFSSSPTPSISPTPEPRPINPAEVVTVDVNLEGDAISINAFKGNKTAACTKFNRVMINGDDNVVTIKGPCRQIMINGDRNKISADATAEFVFNGSSNDVKYSRLINSKFPTVTENRPGNRFEKVSRVAR